MGFMRYVSIRRIRLCLANALAFTAFIVCFSALGQSPEICRDIGGTWDGVTCVLDKEWPQTPRPANPDGLKYNPKPSLDKSFEIPEVRGSRRPNAQAGGPAESGGKKTVDLVLKSFPPDASGSGIVRVSNLGTDDATGITFRAFNGTPDVFPGLSVEISAGASRVSCSKSRSTDPRWQAQFACPFDRLAPGAEKFVYFRQSVKPSPQEAPGPVCRQAASMTLEVRATEPDINNGNNFAALIIPWSEKADLAELRFLSADGATPIKTLGAHGKFVVEGVPESLLCSGETREVLLTGYRGKKGGTREVIKLTATSADGRLLSKPFQAGLVLPPKPPSAESPLVPDPPSELPGLSQRIEATYADRNASLRISPHDPSVSLDAYPLAVDDTPIPRDTVVPGVDTIQVRVSGTPKAFHGIEQLIVHGYWGDRADHGHPETLDLDRQADGSFLSAPYTLADHMQGTRIELILPGTEATDSLAIERLAQRPPLVTFAAQTDGSQMRSAVPGAALSVHIRNDSAEILSIPIRILHRRDGRVVDGNSLVAKPRVAIIDDSRWMRPVTHATGPFTPAQLAGVSGLRLGDEFRAITPDLAGGQSEWIKITQPVHIVDLAIISETPEPGSSPVPVLLTLGEWIRIEARLSDSVYLSELVAKVQLRGNGRTADAAPILLRAETAEKFVSAPVVVDGTGLGVKAMAGDMIEVSVNEAGGPRNHATAMIGTRISTLKSIGLEAVSGNAPEGAVNRDGTFRARLIFDVPPEGSEAQLDLTLLGPSGKKTEAVEQAARGASSGITFLTDSISLAADSRFREVAPGDRLVARYTDGAGKTHESVLLVQGRPGKVRSLRFFDAGGSPVQALRTDRPFRIELDFEAAPLTLLGNRVGSVDVVLTLPGTDGKLETRFVRVENSGDEDPKYRSGLMTISPNEKSATATVLRLLPGDTIRAAYEQALAVATVTAGSLVKSRARIKVLAYDAFGHLTDRAVDLVPREGRGRYRIRSGHSMDLPPGEYLVTVSYQVPYRATVSAVGGETTTLEVGRDLGLVRFDIRDGDGTPMRVSGQALAMTTGANGWGNLAELGQNLSVELPKGRWRLSAAAGGAHFRLPLEQLLDIKAGAVHLVKGPPTGELKVNVTGIEGRLAEAFVSVRAGDTSGAGFRAPGPATLAAGTYATSLSVGRARFFVGNHVIVAGRLKEVSLRLGRVCIVGGPEPGEKVAVSGPLPGNGQQPVYASTGACLDVPSGSYGVEFGGISRETVSVAIKPGETVRAARTQPLGELVVARPSWLPAETPVRLILNGGDRLAFGRPYRLRAGRYEVSLRSSGGSSVSTIVRIALPPIEIRAGDRRTVSIDGFGELAFPDEPYSVSVYFPEGGGDMLGGAKNRRAFLGPGVYGVRFDSEPATATRRIPLAAGATVHVGK